MDSTPNRLPEGVSALRYMIAESQGGNYVNYPTIVEARRDPNATLVMEADSGGQILLTCPVRHVKASSAVLRQLLVDLENISWGNGFDLACSEPCEAEMFLEPAPVGAGVAGGMGGGVVVDGAWLHPDLEQLLLRPQVEEILNGLRQRLDLRPEFPHCAMQSLEEAKRYAAGRMIVVSASDGRPLVNCRADLVRVNLDAIVRLGRELDAVRYESTTLPVESDPRIEYQLGDLNAEPLWCRPGPISRRRKEIEVILEGRNGG
jgi:hypothetical protein